MSFERALVGAAETAHAPGAIVVVSGAVAFDPALLGARADVLWDSRERPELDPELSIGLGVTAEVASETEARELFSRVETSGDGRVRLYGGFAFDTAALGAFRAFGATRFVLPRWTLTRSRGSTRLSLAVDARELARPAELRREVRELTLAAPRRARASAAVGVVSDGSHEFLQATKRAIAAIRARELEKVVVVRKVRVAGAIDVGATLERLEGHPGSVRFAFRAGDGTLAGATPELLVAYDGERVRSEAVAGTCARAGADDAREIARFLASEKDQREHAFVAEHVRARLSACGAELDPEAPPGVRSLRHVHHLLSPISGTLAGAHVLALARALSPTPAVSGVPQARALEWLRRHEAVERGWFAGAFGFFDQSGHGQLIVSLRAALLDAAGAELFAGAGIVSGSDPERELAETEVKLKAMLEALGGSPAPRSRVALVAAGGSP